MGSSSSSSVDVCRVVVIVLLCLEVLVVLPGNVSAVRRADLVLANEEHLVRRSLMVASVPELYEQTGYAAEWSCYIKRDRIIPRLHSVPFLFVVSNEFPRRLRDALRSSSIRSAYYIVLNDEFTGLQGSRACTQIEWAELRKTQWAKMGLIDYSLFG
ncbi:hypothetical protein CRG98_001606 [Punica granatum]|uniref:Uncharacterized protein n=1 Tax=Punica granatum TaxID=22663 RepID=A0A2I0LCQ3_PUNGR|nr:hypothetical protein CRG98_001606 [Punica granatum]